MALEQDIIPPLLIPNENASTSVKSWANGFNDLTNVTLRQSTKREFDTVFGPMALDDTNRITQTVVQVPSTQELVTNEADVGRLFHKQISGVVMPYFASIPLALEADQTAPLGATSFTGSVDTQFIQFSTKGLLAIGEHKTPGVIDSEWRRGRQTSKSLALGRELRG
jgi:hypothetical protein